MKDRPMINKEGFWWSTHEPHLPKPIALSYKWTGRKEFLRALSQIESSIENYSLGKVNHQKGSSRCRLCEEHPMNGSAEYELNCLGNTWRWPEGLRHYVSVHNVRPSLAFQEFILTVFSASTVVKVKKKD